MTDMEPPTRSQDAVTRMVRALLAYFDQPQKDLVDVLGVNATSVTRRMKKGTWTIEDLDAMAQHFGVPVTTFFRDPSEGFGTTFDQGVPPFAWMTDHTELAEVTVGSA